MRCHCVSKPNASNVTDVLLLLRHTHFCGCAACFIKDAEISGRIKTSFRPPSAGKPSPKRVLSMIRPPCTTSSTHPRSTCTKPAYPENHATFFRRSPSTKPPAEPQGICVFVLDADGEHLVLEDMDPTKCILCLAPQTAQKQGSGWRVGVRGVPQSGSWLSLPDECSLGAPRN